MKDFALDPYNTNFERLTGVENSLCLTSLPGQYLAQKIRIRLSIFLGEWYLDTTIGIPYLQAAQDKNTNRTVLEAAIKAKIATTTGVARIELFETTYDGVGRVLRINFIVRDNEGNLVEGAV